MSSGKLKAKKFSQPERLPDQIAQYIGDQIRSGALRPGQKLPAETALAQDFGVSRTVVREALGRLKYDQLVESRQGIGAIVLGDRTARSFKLDNYNAQDKEDWRNLYELRTRLEGETAYLAASRRDEADLAAMRKSLDDLARAARDGDKATEADTEFHRAVARAGKNPYFADLMNYIIDTVIKGFLNVWEHRSRQPDVHRSVLEEHTAIYRAVSDRNPDQARQAVLDHLTNSIRFMAPED